jgi:hypothetical protein
MTQLKVAIFSQESVFEKARKLEGKFKEHKERIESCEEILAKI